MNQMGSSNHDPNLLFFCVCLCVCVYCSSVVMTLRPHRLQRAKFLCPRDSPDFSDGSDSKESACSAGDLGLIPGLGRSPGEGNGN